MTASAFFPNPQGSLSKALSRPGQLPKVGPKSPRPVELLGSLTVTGGSDLTAKDAALSELLISSAYEGERSMNSETMSIPMAFILRYLGEETRRDHVRSSLNRLKSTLVSFRVGDEEYQDVALLNGWVRKTQSEDSVFFSLPEPIRAVMSDRAHYAYVELAALPTMSSTYSSRIYRRLVAAVSESGKRWEPGSDNALTIETTPEEVASWASFPRLRDGRLHVGKLRERVLAGLAADFAAVQAFSFSMSTFVGSGRGRPLERIVFRLELSAPSQYKTRLVYSADHMRFVGGGDRKDLRVNSSVWMRAQQQFRISGRRLMSHRDWFELWLAAVEEMETGIPLTRESEMRVFRGEGLRTKIDLLGADQAAWGFCAEEADVPDIALRKDLTKLGAEAREARKSRIGAKGLPAAEAVVDDAPELPSKDDNSSGAHDTDFDEASEVHLTVDAALTPQEQDDMVFSPLAGFEFLGNDPKKIIVHFRRKGISDTYVREAHPTEDCIVALHKLLGGHIEGVQEYRK